MISTVAKRQFLTSEIYVYLKVSFECDWFEVIIAEMIILTYGVSMVLIMLDKPPHRNPKESPTKSQVQILVEKRKIRGKRREIPRIKKK